MASKNKILDNEMTPSTLTSANFLKFDRAFSSFNYARTYLKNAL